MEKTPKTILISDDDPVIVRMLEKILIRDGYNILKAFSGKEAIEIAFKELPFLIILDILLPDLTGKEVAEKLLTNPATADIPIIFLTITIPLEDDKGEETVTVGTRTYRAMAKPMHTPKLLSIIRKEVNRRLHNTK